MTLKEGLAVCLLLMIAGCSSEKPAEQAAQAPAGSAPPAAAPAPAKPGTSTPEAAIPRPAPKAAAEKKAVPAAPQVTVLEPGTVVRIRTTTALSTKTHEAGQRFEASLADPIVVGGREVVAKGAPVTGKIVDADDGGRVKGRASIAIQLTSVNAGGEPVNIATGSYAVEAKSTVKKDATKVGVGAGIGAAIGAIAGGGKGAAIGAAAGAGAGTATVLATKGQPAVIPAESLVTFKLTAPARISAK